MTTQSGATHDTPVRADCTIDTDGRIAFTLRPPAAVGSASPRLLLRLRPKKGQPEKALRHLDLEPSGDGRLRAVLEPSPALAEGRWDVYLLSEPGEPGERRRVRPGLRDLRALVDGQSRDWPAPVAVRVPYATKDGYLAVRAWLRRAHAEVEGVEVTDRSMTVRARLHGTTFAEEAAVRLRLRGGDGVVRTLSPRVASDGRGFSFTMDYGELATDHGTGNRVWDLSVQPQTQAQSAADAPGVRIGRLFDDVADRKEIYVHPAAVVGHVVVRPYYTVDNDLSVEVTAATA
ncbi:MAG: transferase [Streptomyces sp.]|nr:transferase [Streptomyces sp.]